MLMCRKLLLSFLVVGSFYINTLSSPVIAEVILEEAVQPSLNSIMPDLKPKVKPKHKSKKKTVVITPPIEIDPDQLYKPLDLSVPFNEQDSFDLLTDKKKNGQNQTSDYFDTKTKAKPRALELNGNFITSPEPEIEKKKTFDGAGISINVKPD